MGSRRCPTRSAWTMPKRILLLAGINMGGHERLPMKDLQALLDDLGINDVQTYIQSGNAVMM